MLNLFILIILDQYEYNYFNEENPLENFTMYELLFREEWTKFSHQDKGFRMQDKNLPFLLMEIKDPMGLNIEHKIEKTIKKWKEININEKFDDEVAEQLRMKKRISIKKKALKLIMQMNIYSDANGYVYYHQILFYFMKNCMMKKITENLSAEGAEKLSLKEEETLKKIKKKQQIY